jgi:uncharacterized protein (TIGR02246 family)
MTGETKQMSDEIRRLAARVARLEDREQIQALFMEYRRCLDEKDFSGYAELFTADGEFVAGEIRARGRGEIRALVDGMRGNLLTETTGDDIHVVVNPSIEPDGDRARARSTWIYIIRTAEDQPDLCKVGHYDDTLVREDGRWRFERREAPTDMPAV